MVQILLDCSVSLGPLTPPNMISRLLPRINMDFAIHVSSEQLPQGQAKGLGVTSVRTLVMPLHPQQPWSEALCFLVVSTSHTCEYNISGGHKCPPELKNEQTRV